MRRFVFIILVVLLVASALLALRIGSGVLSWSDFWSAVFHPRAEGSAGTIIWSLRLPRVLAALLIGAGLAASGCVLQGLLLNPLAEPYTLGISGGAAFGVAAVLVLVPGLAGIWGLPSAAFLGALLAVGLIYFIARQQRFSVIGLVLAGIILSFIFSSLVLLIFTLARPVEVNSIIFWLIGNLVNLKTELVYIIPFFIVGGILLFYLLGRELDALSLGDEKAFHLGIEAVRVRQILFIITSLVVGACIATAGMIGFVGLIVPHLMRLLIGPNHRPLILASALGGAVFLIISDTIARTALRGFGQELPVGVVTGILGGIFLLIFLIKKKPV